MSWVSKRCGDRFGVSSNEIALGAFSDLCMFMHTMLDYIDVRYLCRVRCIFC